MIVRHLDAITARALGIGDGAALLARPNGTPVALWPAGVDPATALSSGVASATARMGEPRPAALAA